ncbi:MAG TPA: response regulator [Methylophilaceae bacterium]|nr:response regulator [Methylophilaceae bacterium]
MNSLSQLTSVYAHSIEVALAPDSLKVAEMQQDAKLGSRVHVMLVEDSALIREALVDALAVSAVANFEGFATTASEAITALRAQQFDIVVIDIELAKGTGFDVLLNLNQSDFPFPPPLSIVLTNHAHPVYKYQAELLGVKHFFDKSMHFNEAIDAIEQEASRLLRTKNLPE